MKKNNRERAEPAAARQARSGQCYCLGAGPRITAMTGGMFQGPVFDHFRTAGMEVLLGLRAILDSQIDAMSRRSKRGTRVPVE